MSNKAWEMVQSVDNAYLTDRLRVPQGWLLRHVDRGMEGQHTRCAQLLIDDPAHTWIIKQLRPDEHAWTQMDESVHGDFVQSDYLWVPGGWVVKTTTMCSSILGVKGLHNDGHEDLVLTFIPDPEHTWVK